MMTGARAALVMTCPHCAAQFALTWRRYLSSAFGKHTCPQCGTASQLEWTFGYVAASLAAFALVALGLLLALHFGERYTWEFLVLWVLVALLWIPLDRWFDATLRRLRPMPTTGAGTSGGRGNPGS